MSIIIPTHGVIVLEKNSERYRTLKECRKIDDINNSLETVKTITETGKNIVFICTNIYTHKMHVLENTSNLDPHAQTQPNSLSFLGP